MLTQNYQEHASLFELLKNNKFVKEDSTFYNIATDYSGFYPDGEGKYTTDDLSKKTEQQLDSIANNNDMVYYTDLYGIYKTEWYTEYPKVAPNKDFGKIGDRSPLLYGGMHANDFYLLKKMKGQKKLIINEFNLIASPTSYTLRKAYEEEFGMRWTGWVGRYFEQTIQQMRIEQGYSNPVLFEKTILFIKKMVSRSYFKYR